MTDDRFAAVADFIRERAATQPAPEPPSRSTGMQGCHADYVIVDEAWAGHDTKERP